MLKNILNLNGAQELSKNQQQTIQGGKSCEAAVACGCTGRPNGSGCYTAVPCKSVNLGKCQSEVCVPL